MVGQGCRAQGYVYTVVHVVQRGAYAYARGRNAYARAINQSQSLAAGACASRRCGCGVPRHASALARMRACHSGVSRGERAQTGVSRGAARVCSMRAWRTRFCAMPVLVAHDLRTREVTRACVACCERAVSCAVLVMGQGVSRAEYCGRRSRAGVVCGARSPSGPVARASCWAWL